MAIIEIKKYVAYYAGAKNAGAYPYRAIIGLRNDSDALVGAAYFHHSTTTMPIADTQKGSGYISCHYLADDYPRILDTSCETRSQRTSSLKCVPGGISPDSAGFGSITSAGDPRVVQLGIKVNF